MSKLTVTPQIEIPLNEFEFSFARSSGPGGQNVNKVNSKAVLRWNPSKCPHLGIGPRERFLRIFASRLTTEGELVLTSDRFRDQLRNQEDCIQKLKDMLLSVATPPKPRKKTKPSFSSKLKRHESKRKHADKKRSRQKPFKD